jgi:hypothetical protein
MRLGAWLGALGVWAGATRLVAEEPSSIGLVLDIQGTWLLEGKPPKAISGGDSLPPGATVFPEKDAKEPRLEVWFRSGNVESYTAKAKLPAEAKDSLISRIWSALHGHYHAGVVHAVSRGDQFDDGVAECVNGSLYLSGLVLNAVEGTVLRLVPINSDGKPKADGKPTTATLVAEAEHYLVKGTFPNGLYKLEILDRRSRKPTGDESVLLICSPAEFETFRTQYNDALDLMQSWNEQTRAKCLSKVKQAFLQALADEMTAKTSPAASGKSP